MRGLGRYGWLGTWGGQTGVATPGGVAPQAVATRAATVRKR